MINVTVDQNFTLVPEKAFVVDFNVAFANLDIDTIIGMMSDNAVWELVGAETVTGKDAIKKTLREMDMSPALALKIDSIVSEGERCSANGVMEFKDGSAVAFCDVYQLNKDADTIKVRTLTSYGIDLKKG